MRIAQIVPSLEERHGGPSKSVRALAGHLAQSGLAVDLLATEETPGSTGLAAPEHAHVRVFPRVTPRWLARSPQLRQHLLTTSYACIHHHSLWLLTLRYAAEASQKRNASFVISPRGMMSPWAWRHRRWRKRVAELLVHPGVFAQADGWHATSAEEADDIRALGFRQPVCVSPNGVFIPTVDELSIAKTAWRQLVPTTAGRPVALFYSRFHRKKRVRELIDLWLSAPRGDWLLLIAGLTEDYSAASLTAEIAARGAADRIIVRDSEGHPPPYAAASLFLLPSHSENFGLVIAEALAAGIPTLVTDTTPWSGLAAANAGWCVPWAGFGAALDDALAQTPDQLAAMGRSGRAWMERDFSWSRAAKLLGEFYASLQR